MSGNSLTAKGALADRCTVLLGLKKIQKMASRVWYGGVINKKGKLRF